MSHEAATAPSSNRVVVVTLEKVHTSLAGAAWLQFPRVLKELEDVTVLDLPAHFGSTDWQVPRALFKSMVRAGVSPRTALRRVPIRQKSALPEGEIDVLVVLCTSPFDLFALRWVEPLLARSRRVVAWMIEVWEPNLQDNKLLSEPISLYDHFFVGNQTGAALVKQKLNADNVSYLPPAADVTLFDQFALSGTRPILAMNVGRRAEGQHIYLMDRAIRTNRHYLFDTIVAKGAIDPLEHHQAYAFSAGRSEVMVSNYCRFDQPGMIGDARDVPARIFEGAAAGCLIAGQADQASTERVGFDWDAIVPFGLDGSADALAAVLADPDAVLNYQRAARRSALQCGDYAHRWETLLQTIEMPLSMLTAKRLASMQKEANHL